MELIPDKANFVDFLDAPTEFNPLKNDLQNLITDSGQTIGGNNFQFSRAVAGYVARASFYIDTGAANAYVLTAQGSFKAPHAYGVGFSARFVVSNTNTGASTVNIAGLGVKTIKTVLGDPLVANDLIAGDYVDLIYDGTDFLLFYSTHSVENQMSRKNLLINSDFMFWQRVNTSSPTVLSTATYVCDRFRSSLGTGGSPAATVQRKLLTPGTVLPENGGTPKYAYNHAQTAAATGNPGFVSQRIEDVYTASGQSVMMSFYSRLNSGTVTVTPYIVQSFGTGSPSADVMTAGQSIVLSVSANFSKHIQRISVPSISGKTVTANSYTEVFLFYSINNTFNIDIARPQLEVGDRGTAYERRTIQAELSDCYRYYETSYNFDDYPGKITAPGYYGVQAPLESGGASEYTIYFKSKKRSSPVGATYNPTTGTPGTWDALGVPSSATFIQVNESAAVIQTTALGRGHYVLNSEL